MKPHKPFTPPFPGSVRMPRKRCNSDHTRDWVSGVFEQLKSRKCISYSITALSPGSCRVVSPQKLKSTSTVTGPILNGPELVGSKFLKHSGMFLNVTVATFVELRKGESSTEIPSIFSEKALLMSALESFAGIFCMR